MSVRLCVLLAGASSISLHAARPHISALNSNVQQHAMNEYADFRRQFSVERAHEDEKMYSHRAALFGRRSAEVRAHNMLRQKWDKAVNKFADYTDEEFNRMLGHRLSQRARAPGASAPAYATSLIMIADQDNLAATVDYRKSLNASLGVKDQGACGSGWAVAVTGAMETHAEIHNSGFVPKVVPKVSYEQLVDCVQNPEHCGGTGGCQGATTELGFDYIATSGGVGLIQDYAGYQHGGNGVCNPPQARALTAAGYLRLPENEALPLRAALALHGPVAVSADASGWMMYSRGVFSGCNPDCIVNHAILMMGYGYDANLDEKYWLIRNSWSEDWGENGYIRLLRHGDGESYCGIDTKPKDGVGCDGGPPEIPVCGMCGILSDSAYPTGVQIA